MMERLAPLVFRTVLWSTLAVSLCAYGQPRATSSTESPEERRERALKLSEIFEALALPDGAYVADVGAGSGFITSRLARRIGPRGRVFAVDIDEKNAIKQLNEMVSKQSLSNVQVIHSEPADPKLPAEALDAVLMVNVYHEVDKYHEMLKHVLKALKPSGRLVVVDNMPLKTRNRSRADQTKNHVLAPELAEAEFRNASFEIIVRRDDFVDRPDEESGRWMIVCRKVQSYH